MKSSIGVLGAAETRELAHGPDLAPVHGLVDAARKWILAWVSQVARVVEICTIRRSVKPLDRDPGKCSEGCLALRRCREGPLECLFFPAELGERWLTVGPDGFELCPRFVVCLHPKPKPARHLSSGEKAKSNLGRETTGRLVRPVACEEDRASGQEEASASPD